MKEYSIRLQRGADLKKEIEKICIDNAYNTAIVLCAVGSLSSLNIRLANVTSTLSVDENFEIVSLIGTVSLGKSHLHISVSDEIGNVVGGHLLVGNVVNTTVELVLGILEEYESNRTLDEKTGYNEIVFRKRV